MSGGSRYEPGARVRVINADYGTFDQTGTVTEPDDFWSFGPCVLLDGQTEAGAFLDTDLEPFVEAAVPEPAPPEAVAPEVPQPEPDPVERPARVPRRLSRERQVTRVAAAEPVALSSNDETYRQGVQDGWAHAVRHVAHRLGVEGGARADAAAIAPDVSGLIAGIVARLESAETKALAAGTALDRRDDRERRTTVLPPEPAGEAAPAMSAKTLTMLIQAVSEIVIQERDRAQSKWQGAVRAAETRAEAERRARGAAESALAAMQRNVAASEPPAALRDNALMEVLTCAEEFISGAALNRALVLRALRETLGNLRQVSDLDAARNADGPKRLR